MQAKHESEVLRFRRGKKMQLDIFAARAAAREPAASGLIVDSFAGGGGASLGIEMALGRGPDIAINHDPEAIAMHAVNHPSARHYIENVWKVDPLEATAGKPVSLLWASPNCTHFSKAKGGRPVDNGIRGLAWVVIRWAKTVKPKVIILENVEEFASWGPVGDDGYPCPARRGITFQRWLSSLRNLGYVVEHKELRACDYGAPTSRKRLFVIARCDGKPIVWPAPTHGPQTQTPWRTAAECIDWSIPCPSIFGRSKPLAEKTLQRVARGIFKFILNNPKPFIVPLTHAGDRRVHDIDEPFRTVTCANRGELALVAPTMVQTSWGEREGQAPRCLDIHQPLGTVVAGGIKHAVVSAFLAKHYTGVVGQPMTSPAGTITTRDHHSLVTSHLAVLRNNCDGVRVDEPAPTVTAGGTHLAEVRSFLLKYYGTGEGQRLTDPLGTVTTHDRFGLVEVAGTDYVIADIGLRMLTPRELARAQGFPDEYQLDVGSDGTVMSKTSQVRMIGNSVCPPIAAALVKANVAEAALSSELVA